jgi:excisionase family DNA binding protein
MSAEGRDTEIALVVARLVELVSGQAPVEAPQPRQMPERVLLTVEEAAERLGISRTTTFRLVRTGEIESVRIGRLRRIHVDAVNAYATRLVAA